MSRLESLYSELFTNRSITTADEFFEELRKAECYWSTSLATSQKEQLVSKRSLTNANGNKIADDNYTGSNSLGGTGIGIPTSQDGGNGINVARKPDQLQKNHNVLGDSRGSHSHPGREEEIGKGHFHGRQYHQHHHSVWIDIAHWLHKASITILAILFIEVSVAN